MVELMGFVQRAATPSQWVLATLLSDLDPDMAALPRPDMANVLGPYQVAFSFRKKSNQILGLGGLRMT